MSNSGTGSPTGNYADPCGCTDECSVTPCACEGCIADHSEWDAPWYASTGLTGPVCPECKGTCVQPRTYDDPCETCYGEGLLP